MATPTTQKAMHLLGFVLENVDPKSLLTNLQVMTGVRCEIIRFHEILNYSFLLSETSNKKLKKIPKLKELCTKMENILYEFSRYTTVKDQKFEYLFDEFLKISPSNTRWSYGNRMISNVKYMPFLGRFDTFGWYVCPSGHYYCPEDSSAVICPECG